MNYRAEKYLIDLKLKYKLKDIRELIKSKKIKYEKIAIPLSVSKSKAYNICKGENWCGEFEVGVIRKILKCASEDIVEKYDPNRNVYK